MRLRNLLPLLLLLPMTAVPANAANHYIRAGASGSNNGTDWTNAWQTLGAVTWTRGDVYYISSGSYSGVTWSTANSGTTVIELRAAIGGAGDHGTSTGWSDGFQGQAIITPSTITTNYWTLNGQAVSGCVYPNDSASCHLIKFNNTATSGQALQLGSGSQVTNIRMDYIEVQGSNVHTDPSTDEGIQCTPGPCDATYVGHSWIHNPGCDNLSFNQNTGASATFEYDWISYDNNGPTTGAHCQGIQSTLATMVMRYNVFQDMQSSGAITDAAGGNAPITEWDIYGNIFFWDAAWTATWLGDGRVGYDDGVVGIFSLSPNTGILKMYNNLMYGLGLSTNPNCNGQWYTINGGMNFTTVVIENNLAAKFATNCNAGSAGAGTYDYNAYYQIANSTNDAGAHTTSSASAAPFVNPTASTVAGFALSTNTTAGLTVASPFDTDMLGIARGANGTWERGALQIAGAGGTVDTPNYDNDTGTYSNTVSVTITESTAGSTICYTVDGSTPGAAIPGTCDSAPTQTYSTSVSITATATTLKAIGTKAALTNSAVKSAVYTLTNANPTANPVAGSYNGTQSVTLSTVTTGGSIRYTTNGSSPACPATGTAYSGAFSINVTATVKAIACKSNFNDSSVLSASYTITQPQAAPSKLGILLAENERGKQ